MKPYIQLSLTALILASTMTTKAAPFHRVITDSETSLHAEDFHFHHTDIDLKTQGHWSIQKHTLHGGKQEGVELIEIDNGKLKFAVIPTRGMSIYKVWCGDVSLGWKSPVDEIVNPAFINLESRGGLGWLDGFNEMMVRCGVEFAGHPGEDDDGRMLTLHGKIGNIPASKVEIIVDDKPPYRIRIRGRVDEKTFKFSDYELWTEISTVPGSNSFQVSDTLTNKSDYEREYQIIYHGNFSQPLLEEGSKFVAAIKEVSPFNDDAANEIKTWATYFGPTKDYGETVFTIIPYADKNGDTDTMLHNADGDRGVAVSFNINELPYLTLWKNTDTLKEGYVTGIEPGSGFPYNKSVERKAGRVPTLRPGKSQSFSLEYTVLLSSDEVKARESSIKKIQGSRKTKVNKTPVQ